MRAAGQRACQKNSANLDPAFHTATSADLHFKGTIHGKDWGGDRWSLSRYGRRYRKNPCSRRQDCFRPISTQRRVERTRKSPHGARKDLASALKNDRPSRHLLFGFSGTLRIQLPGVVAFVRRRFVRV